MNAFIVIVAYLFVGMVLRRIRTIPEDFGVSLNAFVIYVSLPALVLLKIPHLTLTAEAVIPAVMPWALLLISAGAVLFCARLFAWERSLTGCLLLLIPLGNTSFLGIPMVKVFFGESGVAYAMIYDQVGTFLALSTYGSLILAAYGQASEAPTVASVARRIATFPPFLALLAAVAVGRPDYPAIIQTILEALGSTLVPVVMVAVGFQLVFRLPGHAVLPFGIGLVIKLVLAPLLALLFCKAFGIDGEAARVAVLEAGMPPMISAGALAILAGLAPELSAALVGFGIFLSFLTLPILHRLIAM